MNDLTDAGQKLEALIQSLQLGLDLSAHIYRPLANGAHRPELVVEFAGPDTPLLTVRNGELLHAIEHIAVKILRLEPEEHDRICFDVDNFRATREREIERLAAAAIVKVKATDAAYVFPPMMSRERRLLHLALASSGLRSASTGEHLQRSVVLYPEGVTPPQD